MTRYLFRFGALILLFSCAPLVPACAGLPGTLGQVQSTVGPILEAVASVAGAFNVDPAKTPATCEVEPTSDGHVLILCDMDVGAANRAK